MLIQSILILLIIAAPWVFGIQITEIMFDPLGKDNQREYVEVRVDGVSLDRYVIVDNQSNDTLLPVRATGNKYAVIVEKDSLVNISETASVYQVGASIGNTLHNEADTVSLFDPNGTFIDSVSYIADSRAKKKGLGICRNGEVWSPCTSTPGAENVFQSLQTSPEFNRTPQKQGASHYQTTSKKSSAKPPPRQAWNSWQYGLAFAIAGTIFIILSFFAQRNGDTSEDTGDH